MPSLRVAPRIFDARRLLDLFDDDADDILIASALGVGRKTVGAWRRGESYLITAYRADRIAIHIGTHPSLVWGRQWWSSAGDDL